MTKLKYIFTILITILIVLFTKNVSYGEQYTGADGLVKMIDASNPNSFNPNAFVGSNIYLSYKELPGTNLLYCVAHGKRSRSTDYRNFTIENYVLLEGNKATSADGKVVENPSNAVLAAILGGGLEPGYGNVGDYGPAQQALYKYWDDWIDAVGTPNYGLSMFNNRTRNATYTNSSANTYLQYCQNLVAQNKNFGVGIYFLIDKTASNYQEVILTCPRGLISTDDTPQVTINKYDKDTKANIAGISFVIRNKANNQYIQTVDADGTVSYTSNENDAFKFKTGELSTGYKPITIKKLPAGNYVLKEYSTDDSNYYSPTNIGKETDFTITQGQSVTLEIENTSITENEDNYIQVTVRKVWNDSNNKYGARPETIWVILYGNGEEIGEAELSESNNWTYTFTNLPKNKNYSVAEEEVIDDYESSISRTTSENKITYKITNKYIPPDNGNGNVTISGIVWEDLFLNGKSNNNNSKKDSKENGIEGIKVYWKNSSGDILASDITDSNGYYEMAYKLKVTKTEHGKTIYNNDLENTSAYKKLNNSYIEFEYNGLKYTTVANAKSGTDKSKAVELTSTRTTLDNYFDEVNSKGVIDNGQLKYRLDYNSTNNISTLKQSNTKFGVKASTNSKLTGISNLLDNAETEEGYYAHDVYWHDCRHCSGRWRKTDYYYDTDEWHIYNMNLGLVKREQPDIAVTTDIEKVRVIMKGQEYTYVYNNRNIASDTNVTQYCVSFEKKYTPGVYTRPVNPSDIAYMQDKNDYDSNVQVYVTYVMRVKNQSNTLPVQIKEIVNYYDDDYEVTYDSAINWKPTSKYGEIHSVNGYKSAYNTQLQDKTLAPGAISETLRIEYHVNQDTVKSLINKQDVLLRNVIEINGYRTLYGAETQCAENKKASAVGKTNTQYAGVDLDSAPGNTTPGNTKTYEDDTDEAPNFKLTKNNDYRIISGTVWEDTQTTASKNKNERLGDGVKSSEKNVENVRVELYRITDEDEEVLAERNMIINGRAVTYPAITYTDSNGNYQFEGVVTDNYILKFIYGNNTEVIYANAEKLGKATKINGNIINARNYKSTIITKEPVKSAIQGNGDDQWHLTVPDSASVAVDDLSERLSIPELKYSNYNDPINMVAYSAPFRMQVEVEDKKDSQAAVNHQSQVDENGGSFENNWSVFDFGIIERPREDIVIEKTIENLKITLANGQVLTEGNPYTESLNYVKAIGSNNIRTRTDAIGAKQKQLSIEMDSELIQGARLDILYAITVTNNSEKDYEYDSRNGLGGNEKYYYYGEVGSLPLIKPSSELVVDYMDSELTCTTEDERNKNWQQVQADDLKGLGYISEATCKKAQEENYLIFVTSAFKDIASGSSHTEYLFASKLLANQANDYTYENHAEIIRLNGKIARTIDKVDDSSRKQVTKTYKMGDYVPSSTRKTDTSKNAQIIASTTPIEEVGLHEQDDDMIKITITPPTGLENNTITYVIIAGVALVVIAAGIFIIKKKVL